MQYRRDVLVHVLIYHYRKDDSSCGCGWNELGKSHPEHVANEYEKANGCICITHYNQMGYAVIPKILDECPYHQGKHPLEGLPT